MHTRARLLLLPAALGMQLLVGACFKTDLLVTAFNNGALDTGSGDPFHDPNDLARELVATRMRQQLGDGYFQQGSGAEVAQWMDNLAKEGTTFTKYVVDRNCLNGVAVGNLCAYSKGVSTPYGGLLGSPDAGAGPTTRARSRADLREFVLEHTMKVGSVAPVCSNGVPDKAAVAHAADFVRFEVAVDHAADAAAELVADGLVNAAQVVAGAKEAFEDTAQYLRDRGWKRSVARHTTALVSKGGASTGIYTAGAAWAVLNLINECMNSPWCGGAGADDYRFDMMSGTSTGALVNTVVDLFNSQKDHSDRGNELSALANWFTCSGMNDLYCVRSEPILDLVRSTGGSDSLLEFQGLTKKLRGAVNCGMYKNGSELILNTTDFRSGRLLDLSDGERFSLRTSEDLVQGALASAALPFIVRPAYTLPANYDASVPSFYLDGGIRSEIPIMPVVRRGAERVLVIGSDAPVGSESPKISNALGMATRYIDVTLSGVIETELAQSQSYAEARRLEEIDACHDALAPADGSVESGPVAGACSSEACRDALCEGRWDDLCNGGTRPATSFVAAKSADVRAAPRRQRVTEERSVQLEPLWKMVTLFRDETHIEALHGYTFDPVEQRRLFLAGADAVRVSCARIARLLDMRDPTSAAQSQELASWCAPSLDPGICGNVTHVGKPEACPGPTPPPPASFLAQCR